MNLNFNFNWINVVNIFIFILIKSLISKLTGIHGELLYDLICHLKGFEEVYVISRQKGLCYHGDFEGVKVFEKVFFVAFGGVNLRTSLSKVCEGETHLQSNFAFPISVPFADRNYSTLAIPRPCSVYKPLPALDPRWVTGFTDGEGCFHVTITQRKDIKVGWAIVPRFSIALHVKDKPILMAIKKSLGVGKIYKERSQTDQLRVESLKELEILINHFNKYPLITKKRADLNLFPPQNGSHKNETQGTFNSRRFA